MIRCWWHAGEAIGVGEVGPVAGEPAGFRELAPLVDRRQPVAGDERHYLLAPAEEERIGGDQHRCGAALRQRREGGLDLALVTGVPSRRAGARALVGVTRFGERKRAETF
jgi:hypothetical protein